MKDKGTTLLIGLGAPEPGHMAMAGGYGDHDAKVEAAQDLIDAVKEGDAEAVAEAYKVMYDLCADSGDYDDEMY